jgi:hypothetical protein
VQENGRAKGFKFNNPPHASSSHLWCCCLDPLAYGTQTFVAGSKPIRRLLPKVASRPQIIAPLTLSLMPAAQALSSASRRRSFSRNDGKWAAPFLRPAQSYGN